MTSHDEAIRNAVEALATVAGYPTSPQTEARLLAEAQVWATLAVATKPAEPPPKRIFGIPVEHLGEDPQ